MPKLPARPTLAVKTLPRPLMGLKIGVGFVTELVMNPKGGCRKKSMTPEVDGKGATSREGVRHCGENLIQHRVVTSTR